jgi:hypothetical protein
LLFGGYFGELFTGVLFFVASTGVAFSEFLGLRMLDLADFEDPVLMVSSHIDGVDLVSL